MTLDLMFSHMRQAEPQEHADNVQDTCQVIRKFIRRLNNCRVTQVARLQQTAPSADASCGLVTLWCSCKPVISLLVAESLLLPAAAPCLFAAMALFLLLIPAEALCLLPALGMTAGEGGSRKAWDMARGLSMGLLVLLSRAGSGRPLRLLQARLASRSRAWRMGDATDESSSPCPA